MSNPEQSFKTHTRRDPAFHFVLIPILVLNVIFFVIHLIYMPGWFNGWLVVLAAALLLLAFKTRMYAAKVQDRVIRLEERLRLERLASDALRPRIAELTEGQLVALRFASDDQVSALAAQALDEHLGRNEIKKRIVTWRPDYFRV
jgi:hypothetical protein